MIVVRAHPSAVPDHGRMADIPLSPEAKITVERRGQIVLIGAPGQDRQTVRDQGRHARSLRQDPAPQQAPDRGCPWRYLEHGPLTASGGRHPGGQRRRAVRPGREHARTAPWRRLDHPVPAGSGMGERHALYAHRRPLGRGGGLPDGRDPGDRPQPRPRHWKRESGWPARSPRAGRSASRPR